MRDVIKFGQKNQLFLGVVLVQVQFKFGTSTRYGLEILHQCGKRVKIKSSFEEVTGEELNNIKECF